LQLVLPAGNSGGIGIAVTLNIKGKGGELLQHWVGRQTEHYTDVL